MLEIFKYTWQCAYRAKGIDGDMFQLRQRIAQIEEISFAFNENGANLLTRHNLTVVHPIDECHDYVNVAVLEYLDGVRVEVIVRAVSTFELANCCRD